MKPKLPVNCPSCHNAMIGKRQILWFHKRCSLVAQQSLHYDNLGN